MGLETVLIIAIAVLGLVVAGLAVIVVQLFRQQGRLLLRLDRVERLIGGSQPDGLAVGTALPDFELPDLDGRQVALKDLRGQRVLLIHWSARCGFCALMAPELAAMQDDLGRAGVRVLLVTSGEAEEERKLAREHGLECPILLQERGDHRAGLPAFAHHGTPVAYLLDADGKVAEPLAVGSQSVPALARRAVNADPANTENTKKRLPGERPLSESRIEREGLKPGTPAPNFELPEVRGGKVSLAAHRGRKVLLVFSDPDCAPCEQLAPHLVRLHEEHRNNGLDLLLVGRGDPEENRRKAEEHGFEFPVLLQHRWEISLRYGIFATPVGFLIDENGVITERVAKGVDQILALAPSAPARERSVRNG